MLAGSPVDLCAEIKSTEDVMRQYIHDPRCLEELSLILGLTPEKATSVDESEH